MPDQKDQPVQDGFEEKAANVLNAVMVMALGSALGALGAWVLWRFGTDFWVKSHPTGRNTDWMDLGFAAIFIVASVQTVRFGAGMLRSRGR